MPTIPGMFTYRAGATRIVLALRLPVCLAAMVAGVAEVSARAQSPRIIDQVDLGSAASRTAHLVVSSRAAEWREVISLGTLTLPTTGFQIAPGGLARARLKTDAAPGEAATIQVTLATSPKDYGKKQSYLVRLNGNEVYRVTEVDAGGGPTRSFFIDAPVGSASIQLEIAADAISAAPVTVTACRVFAMPPAIPPSTVNETQPKMGLALVSPDGSGYALDEPTLRETFHKLPRSPYLDGQLAVLYNFCTRNAAENRTEIERLAALAERTRIPLRIAFQVHWGGSPAGVPDGAGGKFSDLPYQQITFDPADKIEDPGLAALMGDRYDVRFGLSVPNRWSNTPWLTFNHPRLNQLRRIRLAQALTAWRECRERLILKGRGRLLPLELSTGDETVYWAKGVDDSVYAAANGGAPRNSLSADYNPFVVTDALNDGVVLDPRDGLSLREREWLHRNLARQQQRVVDWMVAALPAEPIRMSGAVSMYSRDLPRRNVFTEPYAMGHFPMKDVSPWRPGMEAGYVQGGRSGGEYWSGATMLPWLLKERERGRIALPNLECSGADDPQILACLRAAYACGARFATLYNWKSRPGIAKLLRTFSDSLERPSGQEFPTAAIGFGAKWEREYEAPADAWAVNRVELYPQDKGPISVRITLRDVERGCETAVTTMLMAAPESRTAAVTLPSPFHQEPGRKYLLSVVPLGAASVSFGVGADVKIACRLLGDVQAERGRSRLMEDWQDARDLLDSLAELHSRGEQSLFAREALQKAETLFAAGIPAEAYAAAIRAEQLSLPASFALTAAGGRMTPYWISVLNNIGPVRATLTTYNGQAATVVLKSPVAQRVTLRWGRIETSADLSPDVAAEISLAQYGSQAAAPAVARPRRRIIRRRRHSTATAGKPILGPPAPRTVPPGPRR